jgi:hypothetical protein
VGLSTDYACVGVFVRISIDRSFGPILEMEQDLRIEICLVAKAADLLPQVANLPETAIVESSLQHLN